MRSICQGAIPEIITDGIDGFLIYDFSVEGLKNELMKVIELYKDAKLEKISESARARAENFGIEKYISQLSGSLHKL